MYSLTGFGSMIVDRIRTDAYCEALRRIVRPGSIVLDIGTGTGIFALLACRFGARRVYAIEPGDAIEIAREIAVANRCDDRIEFIQALSTKVDLPEPANVIVSDIRGILPPFQHHIPSIVDARQRLLVPGGVLIPHRDTLWAAVAEAADLYKRYTEPWEENPYEFDMTPGRAIVTNTWGKGRVGPEQLITEPECWATLDYREIVHANIRGEVNFIARRRGIGHGVSVWFDALLTEGVGYSNSPMSPELVYGTAFFPWSAPVSLEAGDTISVDLRADSVGDDYVWRWDSRVNAQGDVARVKATFRQSTFFGSPLSGNHLRKRAASYVPQLSDDGQVDRFILGLMDGRTSSDQIARAVCSRFIDRFPTRDQAVSYVGDLSVKYGRCPQESTLPQMLAARD